MPVIRVYGIRSMDNQDYSIETERVNGSGFVDPSAKLDLFVDCRLVSVHRRANGVQVLSERRLRVAWNKRCLRGK